MLMGLPRAVGSARLAAVRISHFRNLGVQELEFPPEGVAIVGENAQGKTNFIEALYYLETLRSLRGAREDELLAFGQGVFRLTATCGVGDGACETVVAFERKGRRKKVTLDGSEPERLGEALGRLGAVAFSPADVSIVGGAPAERRRFLDIVLSLNVPGYLRSLQRFRQVLAQRNAALRAERPASEVRAWDGALVRWGAEVVLARAQWVRRHAASFAALHDAMAGGQGALVEYEPGLPLGEARSTEAVAEAYQEGLAAAASRERLLGSTVVGPHRDELLLKIAAEDGRWLDVRRFGSGGQRRTVALALRLIEAETVREVWNREPLVLLDDVFAELDAGRSERVLHLLERGAGGQVILTAPKESEVRLGRDRLVRWRIEAGRLLA